MTDQQALEHIDQRMTEARDAEGRLSAKQATIDMTRAALNEAGVLSGPLPERVRKLSADLRDVTADRDRLRAERTQVRELLDDHNIAADLRALDHPRERLAMPRGNLAAIRAILDKTGDYGTLPDRVQKLVNDWRTGGRALIRISALVMAGENESAADAVDRYVSTTRQQFAGWVKVTEGIDAALTAAGIEPGPNTTLADRADDLARQRDRHRDELAAVRELLDGAGIASDTIPAAVAMLLKERAEWRARTPPAPDVAPGGVEWTRDRTVTWHRDNLNIDGVTVGYVFWGASGWSVVHGTITVFNLPNEPTARAVLLALAGQECGRVVFGLREDAPVGALIAAVIAGLGSFVTDPVAGGTTWTKDPATVRAWVEHGQAALTIEAVAGV